MREEIPQWAKDRARSLVPVEPRLMVTVGDVADAFARYIAQHEQPPVDPDVLAVREIASAFVNGKAEQEAVGRGECDNSPQFRIALDAFRKHR